MLTRREFAAAAAGAITASSAPKYQPRFAGQTYVWSQHFARLKQPLEPHREEVLAAFAKAGYTEMELFTPFVAPEVAGNTYELLDKYKLRAPIVYFGGAMHTQADADATVQKAVEFVERIQGPLRLQALNFNANPKPKSERKTDAELDIQSRAIDRLGAELAKRKIRFFVHQHAPEMAENAREWRHMLRNTDKRRVEICLDVHWIFRGGQDVMTLLEEAAPRLGSMHLRNSRNKIWLEELADGDVDYRAVARYLKQTGFRGWLIPELAWDNETQITRPLEENLRRSLDYTKLIFA
jgi:inosose dehydratase